ncbi:MAG: adhesive domain-containing protein, partial [Mycoplasmatales bacterium]
MKKTVFRFFNICMLALIFFQAINGVDLVFLADQIVKDQSTDEQVSDALADENQAQSTDHDTPVEEQTVQEVPPVSTEPEAATNPVEEGPTTSTEDTTLESTEPVKDQPSVDTPVDVTEVAKDQSEIVEKTEEVQEKPTFATFDGSDLSKNQAFEFDGLDLFQTPKKLVIEESFANIDNKSEPKIEVQVKNALMLTSAPGLSKTADGQWIFDETSVPSELKSAIKNVEFSLEPKLFEKNDTRGTITFYLNDAVEKISLELFFGLAPSYSLTDSTNDRKLVEPLKISSSYTQAQTEQQLSSQDLSNLAISSGTGIGAYFAINENLTPKQAANQLVISPYAYLKDKSNLQAAVYIKDTTFKIRVPKAANYQKISEINGFGTLKVIDVDNKQDTDYTILTINAKDFYTDELTSFTINFKDLLNEKTTNLTKFELEYPFAVTDALDQVITFSGEKSQPLVKNFSLKAVSAPLVVDGYGTQSLSVMASQLPTTNLLGGFSIKNPGTDTLSNQKVRLNFSSASNEIGVEAFSAPNPNGMKDITAITNLGATKTIASSNATTFSKSDFGITASGEYFKEVYWTYEGTFEPGWGNQSQNFSSIDTIPIKYYGIITSNSVTGYYTSITAVDSSLAFTDPKANTSRNTIQITAPQAMTFKTSSNLNTTLNSGQSFNAEVSIDMSDNKSSSNSVLKEQGFNIYLSQKEFFAINPKSIVVTWDGNTYSTADKTLFYVKSIDSQGNLVYMIQLNKVILGYSKNDGTKYSDIKINYDFSVLASSPSGEVSASDLVQVKPTTDSIDLISSGTDDLYHDTNKFNVSGSGDATQILGVAPKNQKITIVDGDNFIAQSLANSNGGAWSTYDETTSVGTVDVHTTGTANYKLVVQNGSSSEVSGYTALVPIPKAGESTDMTGAGADNLQPSAFTWSASLSNQINPNGKYNYTVLYSTTYETNKDSANFVNWASIANK